MVPRSRCSLAGARLGSAPPQMVERSEIVQAFDEKASCWRQRFNRRNNETWERTILQPPRIALPMVPPASWLRPSMPRMPPPPPPPLAPQPTTQLEKNPTPPESGRPQHPTNIAPAEPSRTGCGEKLEKVHKLSEWAHRRIQPRESDSSRWWRVRQ